MNQRTDVFHLERQPITIQDFPSTGWILDIGGGGEGIIGRLKGSQVIAIDKIKRELEEAPDGPLKIIMDATQLQFLDGSFDTVTTFCSLFFMPTLNEQLAVLKEAFRVLRPGGQLLLWDVIIPPRKDPQYTIFVVPLSVVLPHETVRTGYGTYWENHEQDRDHFISLAQEAGFQVAEERIDNQLLYFRFSKPENFQCQT